MKCQSRIIREYKTSKADCKWPECSSGPTDVGTLPVCGGDVTVIVRAVDEPDWGGHSAVLNIKATCSRCKFPFWPKRITWEANVLSWDGWDVTSLLEKFL